jgi:hypothetical protein
LFHCKLTSTKYDVFWQQKSPNCQLSIVRGPPRPNAPQEGQLAMVPYPGFA